MSMEDNHIDELFKQHLEKEVVPFDATAWEDAVKLIKPGKKAFWTWKTYSLLAIVALISSLFIFQQTNKPSLTSSNGQTVHTTNNAKNDQNGNVQSNDVITNREAGVQSTVFAETKETAPLKPKSLNSKRQQLPGNTKDIAKSIKETNASQEQNINSQSSKPVVNSAAKDTDNSEGNPEFKNNQEVPTVEARQSTPQIITHSNSDVHISEKSVDQTNIEQYSVSDADLITASAIQSPVLFQNTRPVLEELPVYLADISKYSIPTGKIFISGLLGVSKPLRSNSSVMFEDFQYDMTGKMGNYSGVDLRYEYKKIGLSIGFQTSTYKYDHRILADQYDFSFDTSIIVRSQEYYVNDTKYWLIEEQIDSTEYNTNNRVETYDGIIQVKNIQIPVVGYYIFEPISRLSVSTMVGVIGNNVTSISGASFNSKTQKFSDLSNPSSEWSFGGIAGLGLSYNLSNRLLVGLESKFMLETSSSDPLLNSIAFKRINTEFRIGYRLR